VASTKPWKQPLKWIPRPGLDIRLDTSTPKSRPTKIGMWIRNILILVLLYYFTADQIQMVWQNGAEFGFQQGYQQGYNAGKQEAITRLMET
jgi:hypothetical protein